MSHPYSALNARLHVCRVRQSGGDPYHGCTSEQPARPLFGVRLGVVGDTRRITTRLERDTASTLGG
jgi:hypothetical protein